MNLETEGTCFVVVGSFDCSAVLGFCGGFWVSSRATVAVLSWRSFEPSGAGGEGEVMQSLL